MATLTQDQLKSLLMYDPATGMFTWRVSRPTKIKPGDVAGNVTPKGYVSVGVKGKIYRAHRLAWLYVYGRWPNNEIDHINRIRNDNRIANLREADRSVNTQNTNLQRNNTSGFRGVDWHKHRNAWRARISVNGKMKNLGYYLTREDAAAAYLKASIMLHLFRPTLDADATVQR
jgi:hypothetical protein